MFYVRCEILTLLTDAASDKPETVEAPAPAEAAPAMGFVVKKEPAPEAPSYDRDSEQLTRRPYTRHEGDYNTFNKAPRDRFARPAVEMWGLHRAPDV